jgi:hypothetical protein
MVVLPGGYECLHNASIQKHMQQKTARHAVVGPLGARAAGETRDSSETRKPRIVLRLAILHPRDDPTYASAGSYDQGLSVSVSIVSITSEEKTLSVSAYLFVELSFTGCFIAKILSRCWTELSLYIVLCALLSQVTPDPTSILAGTDVSGAIGALQDQSTHSGSVQPSSCRTAATLSRPV